MESTTRLMRTLAISHDALTLCLCLRATYLKATSMTLTFTCPHCNFLLNTNAAKAGMTLTCPNCHGLLVVPTLPTPQPSFVLTPIPASRARLKRSSDQRRKWIAFGTGLSLTILVVLATYLASLSIGPQNSVSTKVQPDERSNTNTSNSSAASLTQHKDNSILSRRSASHASQQRTTTDIRRRPETTSAPSHPKNASEMFDALGYFRKETTKAARTTSHVGVVISIPKGLLMPTPAEFTRLLEESRKRDAHYEDGPTSAPPASSAHVLTLDPSLFTMEFAGGTTVPADCFLMPRKGDARSLSSHYVTIVHYAQKEFDKAELLVFCVGAAESHPQQAPPLRIRYKQYPPVAVGSKLFSIAELPKPTELESLEFTVPRIHIPPIPTFTPPKIPVFAPPVIPR